jgi:hypothetical protein
MKIRIIDMALSSPLEIPRGFLEFETILRGLPSVLNGSHVPAGITHVTGGGNSFSPADTDPRNAQADVYPTRSLPVAVNDSINM